MQYNTISQEPNYKQFVQDLESSINSENPDFAAELVQRFFRDSIPCRLSIENAAPVLEQSKFLKYIENLTESPYHRRVNEDIYKRLIKAGHSHELAKNASTGVSTMEEAFKKIQDLNKVKSRKGMNQGYYRSYPN